MLLHSGSFSWATYWPTHVGVPVQEKVALRALPSMPGTFTTEPVMLVVPCATAWTQTRRRPAIRWKRAIGFLPARRNAGSMSRDGIPASRRDPDARGQLQADSGVENSCRVIALVTVVPL